MTREYGYGDAARDEIQVAVPPSVSSLLDVGCGLGLFGGELRAKRPGLEVWGIDSSDAVVTLASERLDRFIRGVFPEDLPDRRFDCITFNDSLEHMVDPWAVLRKTSDLLEDGGVIVLSLPNIRNYGIIRRLSVNGEWEYKDGGILDRTHLRFFTRRSAQRMLVDCGYVVERVEPLDVSRSGPSARVLRLFGKRSVEFRARQFLFVARRVEPEKQ